jgi:hypothetical protein
MPPQARLACTMPLSLWNGFQTQEIVKKSHYKMKRLLNQSHNKHNKNTIYIKSYEESVCSWREELISYIFFTYPLDAYFGLKYAQNSCSKKRTRYVAEYLRNGFLVNSTCFYLTSWLARWPPCLSVSVGLGTVFLVAVAGCNRRHWWRHALCN